MKNTKQLLRDVLPSEFFQEFMEMGQYFVGKGVRPSAAALLLDVEVKHKYDSHETPWPDGHRNVNVWWKLRDGTAVGWNENPGRGWSFPVARKRLCRYRECTRTARRRETMCSRHHSAGGQL